MATAAASDTPAEDSAPLTARPRVVGRTGVIVSPVTLDGAVFGWAAGMDETARVLDTFTAAGGNTISTADHYAGGRSEIMIGSWLRGVRDRSRLILETRIGRHPDAAGLSRRSMLRAVENSLTRLQTDYIDFLSLDGEDASTPIQETLETAARLVSEGKVRYLSAARFSPHSIREVERIAEESGYPSFSALLVEYNLLEREKFESEVQTIAIEWGRGALTRFPLAGGYLMGVYRSRDDIPPGVMFEDTARHISRRGDRIVSTLRTVASELGQTPTAVALAWVLLKPGIASVILRVKDSEQLEMALEGLHVRLARHQAATLDRISET